MFAAFTLATAFFWQSMFGGLPIDGIQCNQSEGAVVHIHAHLQLFDRGRRVTVPAYIGISPAGNCLYWLHTHAADGIIHIESPVNKTFTLGEFFNIWQQPLSRTRADGIAAPRGHRLRVTVNGRVWPGDPRAIPLRDHEEIVIQNGPPYAKGTPANWSAL